MKLSRQMNRVERSEMAMVSIYSVWQGYAVAVQSRRWKKQVHAFRCRPTLKGRTSAFYRSRRKRPYTIIYQTTEDDAEDTVVPRLNFAGGNGEKLSFIKEDEKYLSFGDNHI